MINLSIKIVFFFLLAVFIFILFGIFVPDFKMALFKIWGSAFLLFEWIVFFLLATFLIFLTFKNKVKGRIKKFLLLTGFSVLGFMAFIWLHNLVSIFLSTLLDKGIEEPIFFFLAVLAVQ